MGREKMKQRQHPWCSARIEVRIGQVSIGSETHSGDGVAPQWPKAKAWSSAAVLGIEDA